jgi:hypothetical protein
LVDRQYQVSVWSRLQVMINSFKHTVFL